MLGTQGKESRDLTSNAYESDQIEAAEGGLDRLPALSALRAGADNLVCVARVTRRCALPDRCKSCARDGPRAHRGADPAYP